MIHREDSLKTSEPAFLFVLDEGVDEFVKPTLKHAREIVESEIYPVVGDATLGEIIGSDLFAAVTGTYLGSSGVVPLVFLLLLYNGI